MKYFLVGIKGVGMTSLATIYKKCGYQISGSDTNEQFFTDDILKKLGIPIVGFEESAMPDDIERVIYSSAYQKEHPQIAKAMGLGKPVISYAEALAELFNNRRGVLVTGTHGKTTSTAMLGRVLEDAGFDPTVVVGGALIEWQSTARAGKGSSVDTSGGVQWIVAEGDEYQAKILMLKPYLLLLTNIEYDHPDFYKTEADYKNVFLALLESLPDTAYVVAHESLGDFVVGHTKAHTIFFGGGRDREFLESLKLRVWGEHNKINAIGVLRAAEALGVERIDVLKTLSEFRGTKRRMELFTREDADIVILDDYAHHPTEIRATLRALRERYPDRSIVAIFQPHTYSRTKALLDDFASSFSDATHVVLLDIYSSAREKERSVHGEDLYEKTKINHPSVAYAPTLADAYTAARTFATPQSVFVTLGAGDVWHVARRLVTAGESE